MNNNRKGKGVPPAKKRKIEVSQCQRDKKDIPQKTRPAYRASDSRSGSTVSPEQIQDRRQIRVPDEIYSDDEVSTDCGDSDSSTGESVDLSDDAKLASYSKKKVFVRRKKVILEEKGVNDFEMLPLDWTTVRHQSGMPVYMHRSTQVCTLSKPYFLRNQNAKRHDIPISAIPCLAYKRALDKEERHKLIVKTVEEQIEDTWVQGTLNLNHKERRGEQNVGQETFDDLCSNTSVHEEVEVHISRKSSTKKDNVKLLKGVCPIKHGRHKSTSKDAVDEDSSSNSQDDIPLINRRRCIGKRSDIRKGSNDDHLSNGCNKNLKSTNLSADTADIRSNGHANIFLDGSRVPCSRVEAGTTSRDIHHLTHDQVNDYCKKLFKFKVLNVMRPKRSADRHKCKKDRRSRQCPIVSEATNSSNNANQCSSGQENSEGAEEAADGAQLELTYILTQQMDSQRAYYEDRIAKLETERVARCLEARARAEAAEAEARVLRQRMAALARDNRAKTKRLHQLTAKLATVQSELSEERGMGAALGASQAQWQARARAREDAFRDEVMELKEQLRDVMFYVEANKELEKVKGSARPAPPPAAARRPRRPHTRPHSPSPPPPAPPARTARAAPRARPVAHR